MSNSELGDRLKNFYENRTRHQLPRRAYTIIRLDGKGFSKYTKNLEKPFDYGLINDFNQLTKELCKEVEGCKIGYTQSDEITLVLTDFDGPKSESWFDGNLQKIVSVSASFAAARFGRLRLARDAHLAANLIERIETQPLAVFDSRAFTISDRADTLQELVWRQLDAMRNSVSMIARTHFSHSVMQNKSVKDLKKMLEDRGISLNDFPMGARMGRVVLKKAFLEKLERTPQMPTDTPELVSRTRWVAEDAPLFAKNLSFFDDALPHYPITKAAEEE